jgi:hypothetical protein
MKLFLSNTNLVRVTSLTNALTSVVLSTGTVTFTLTKNSTAVAGASAITCSATTTAGSYAGVIPSTAALEANTWYTGQLTVTDTAGTGYWEIPVFCERRTAQS